MNEEAPAIDDEVIRITAADATSGHVDDLLRRQANLRGETGIARNRRGRWYLQNWFVFMLAGSFAAFLGWALVEPSYDDLVRIRGVVGEVKLVDEPREITTRDPHGKILRNLVIAGTATVRGQRITFGTFTRDLSDAKPIDPALLAVGSVIEVYLEPLPVDGAKEVVWLAAYLDLRPADTRPDGTLTMEQLQQRSHATGMVIFAVMAAFIGLLIGASDGIICRLWGRAAVSGLVGLGVGFLGGFVLSLVANLVYAPLSEIAQAHRDGPGGSLSALGFALQMGGRTLAWGLAGVAMGLGQGIALRSSRLLIFGLVGGVAGGVLGGLLFDPIDLLLLGGDKPSAHVSRLIGFVVIGACVGGLIGLVELLARDAWLRMEEGPLAGKEFLVFKDMMKVGSSPRSDIYLFNDPSVLSHHATLRTVGEDVEVESVEAQRQVLVNDRCVRRTRLRHGDRITLGRTVFVYQRRGG